MQGGFSHASPCVGEQRITYIDWWPQDRQLVCLTACGLDAPFTGDPLRPAIANLIGYGGSAGGGKTDTLLQIAIIAGIHYPKLNIGYFRREFPQLEGVGGAIQRSQEMLGHIAKYNEQKHRWTLPTRSLLQFCHCKDPNDVYNYQSQQFDILLIDEVTQFTREMVKYLLTRNRATVDFPTFTPFAAFGTNPGNVGHGYFKEEFVSLGPPEKVNIFINEIGKPEKHIFIPSRLDDNQILVQRDPGYADRVGNTEMNRKMLLEGSWDIFAGQAFGELNRDIHLIDPFEVDGRWFKYGAYDHGYNHPFSFGVFVVDDDGNVYLIKRAKSRLKRVDEIARIMDEVAGGINTLSAVHAGLDCWSRQRDGGPTIAEQFIKCDPKITLVPANVDRIQGATQVRSYIAWKGKEKADDGTLRDGKPKVYIFRNCEDVYNNLTEMIFDPNRPEDVLKVDADENGVGGDDNYDMFRYSLMSRPHAAPKKEYKPKANTFDAYLKKKQEERWLQQEYVGY